MMPTAWERLTVNSYIYSPLLLAITAMIGATMFAPAQPLAQQGSIHTVIRDDEQQPPQPIRQAEFEPAPLIEESQASPPPEPEPPQSVGPGYRPDLQAMQESIDRLADHRPPTIDEIRQVVREELARVTVTVRATSGVQREVVMPLTQPASKPVFSQLNPGERIIAIDGVPVQPFVYQAASQPVARYVTPQYDMRVLGNGFGAVRSMGSAGTCRIVNGRMQCN
jgi:hypothetical protein